MSQSGTKGLVIMSTVIALVIAGISWAVYTETPGYRLPAAIEEDPTWENYQAYADHLESEKNYQELARVLVEAEKQFQTFRPLKYIVRLDQEVGDTFTQHLPAEFRSYFALKDGDTEGYESLVAKLKAEERFTFLDNVYYHAYYSGVDEAADGLISMLETQPESVHLHPKDLLSVGADYLVKIYKTSPSEAEAKEINRVFATWVEGVKGYEGLHDGFYCEDDPGARPENSEKLVLLQYYDDHHARIHLLNGEPLHVVDLSEERGFEGFLGQKKVGWAVERETTANSYYYRTTNERLTDSRYQFRAIHTGEYTPETFNITYMDEHGDIAPSYFQRAARNCEMVGPFKAEFFRHLMIAEERALADSM